MKYIGMDGHSSTCTFSVCASDGTELDNVRIISNGRLLVDYVKSIEGPKKLVVEECELSQWFYTLLKKHVDELVVCNPVENRAYKRAKTDKLDARSLANLLRGGFIKAVYHDGSSRQEFRSLLSGYEDVVGEAVRLKNRYKSLFRREGNKKLGEKIYRDESLLKDFKHRNFRFMGEECFKQLQVLEESRQRYLQEIRKQSRKFEEIKLLRTIPGIGELHAARISSVVINPGRFKNKHVFFSYCGLVRHPRESDGRNYGTVKGHGNLTLKCVYKMAAQTVLRGKNSFRHYYDYLRRKGVGERAASNAVSRRIAAVSLAVWKHSRKYDDTILLDRIKKQLSCGNHGELSKSSPQFPQHDGGGKEFF